MSLGIGDDAALVKLAGQGLLILTADLSIEGVHFRRDLHPPRSVGHRALARSLSDVAAMGGVPRFALVSLAISRGTSRGWIEGFYGGLLALARRFGTKLVGGDSAVVARKSFVDVIVAGEAAPGRAVERSGARPGDQIFVSGGLGVSALGLTLLKSGRNRFGRLGARAIRAHLYPAPQCALGRFLANQRLASSMIDVSDGLSTDLHHLCESSRVGACLSESQLPAPQVPNGIKLALHGGEDYQLLFTVPRRKLAQLPTDFHGLPLHCIGEIHRGREVVLMETSRRARRLAPGGYDHFKEA